MNNNKLVRSISKSIGLVLSGSTLLVCLCACDEQTGDTESLSADAQRSSSTSGQLDGVTPVPRIEVVDALSKLGRLLDSQFSQTESRSIAVHFEVDQKQMRTDTGATYPLTAEEWKGITTSKSDGVTTARSFPETAHAHNDGLGRLSRNGWKCTVQDELTLMCELVRPVSGYSR